MTLAIVTGIPGVGKSTVLKILQKMSDNVQIINYGDLMLEEAIKRDYVSHRDEIRKLPRSIQLKLQRIAAEKIAELKSPDRIVIVDTHSVIKTPFGYLPGLPFSILDILKPDYIIAIKASPKEISYRRSLDPNRRRDIEEESEIERHLMFEDIFNAAYAAYINCMYLTVQNEHGKQEDAAKKIFKVLSGD
ncbi:adenylate kinase [archaeon]|nr:MAG: adenylate kinase [archaeon]RLG66052.1 MAG: adenylate kinase [archaeon]RLG66132.1 MAG: adenylate kinase [archaeon]HDM23604.1 adenylate kinase [Candidatus Bathyarchaeota archaeon]